MAADKLGTIKRNGKHYSIMWDSHNNSVWLKGQGLFSGGVTRLGSARSVREAVRKAEAWAARG